MQREFGIGIRLGANGLNFFGIDEVNELIKAGWRVDGIKPGGAIVTKVGEGTAGVRMALGGCEMKVLLSTVAAGDASAP